MLIADSFMLTILIRKRITYGVARKARQMNVYVYCADIYCESCGADICAKLVCDGLPDYLDPDNESSYDSDEYPKGPYGNGGGEADTPQHCGACGVFLENPLTGEGYVYVREMADDKSSCSSVIRDWLEFYEIDA